MAEITTTLIDVATQDVAFSDTMTATAVGGAATWSVSAGALPPGITLSSAGVFSGTPTSPGAYRVTIECADSGGADDTWDGLFVVESTATAATPSIATTRTSGFAPLGVSVDAIATTMSGVDETWRNLTFWWEWSDLESGDNNVTRGCMSGHCFETPGTYVVRLTVTKPWTRETATGTVSITVTDQDAAFPTTQTVCVSMAGDFTGAPTGATQITNPTDLGAVLAANDGTDRRILLRRGETFPQSTGWSGSLNANRMVVGAFGTGTSPDSRGIYGNNPIVQAQGLSSFAHWTFNNGDGCVVEHITFDNSQNAAHVSTNNALTFNRYATNITVNKVKVLPTYTRIPLTFDFQTALSQNPPQPASEGVVVSNCDLEGTELAGMGLWGGADKLSVIGCRIKSGDNHAVRLSCSVKVSIWNSDISTDRVERHALKIHGEDSTRPGGSKEGVASSFWTEYFHVANCRLDAASQWAVMFTKQNPNAAYDEWQRRFVMEGCELISQSTGLIGVYLAGPECDVYNNVIVRNGTNGSSYRYVYAEKYGPSPAPEDCRVGNNTFAHSSGMVSGQVRGVEVESTYIGVLPVYSNLLETQGASGFVGAYGPGSVTHISPTVMTGTPGFINEAGGDYGLLSTSPAVNSTSVLPPWDVDYYGYYRDSMPDAGAIEYQGATSSLSSAVVDADVPSLVGEAVGDPINFATVAGTVPALSVKAVGFAPGTAAGTLPSLTAAATAEHVYATDIRATLPVVSADAVGGPLLLASVAAAIPAMTADAAASNLAEAVVAGTLPLTVAGASMTVSAAVTPGRANLRGYLRTRTPMQWAMLLRRWLNRR